MKRVGVPECDQMTFAASVRSCLASMLEMKYDAIPDMFGEAEMEFWLHQIGLRTLYFDPPSKGDGMEFPLGIVLAELGTEDGASAALLVRDGIVVHCPCSNADSCKMMGLDLRSPDALMGLAVFHRIVVFYADDPLFAVKAIAKRKRKA